MNELPDLVVTHKRLENQNSPIWNMRAFVYEGGLKVLNNKYTKSNAFSGLNLATDRIWIIKEIIDYFEERLECGHSENTIRTHIYRFRLFIKYCEEKSLRLATKDKVEEAYFLYAEYLYTKKQKTAYVLALHIGTILSEATKNIRIHVNNTRIKKPKRSKKTLSREADKVNLTESSKLGWLIYDISENFDEKCLSENKFPIYVTVRTELIASGKVSITPQVKTGNKIINKELVFPNSQAKQAFNTKVVSECLFFLAMTTCNPQSAFNLKREEFSYKPLGQTYQVRTYKHRRKGEILFTIPKIYRAKFERYLKFLRVHASETEWLFPFIDISGKYIKRSSSQWDGLRYLCKSSGVPWVEPRSFRKTSLNLLLRLTANENLVSEIANHAVETFQDNYKLPSQQRALVEITRFWDSNDPLVFGSPKVSLFNTHCNGEPNQVENMPVEIAKPDCLTPSGCFWCKHFRDENSFDYIWNIHSYRFLKVIESSSYVAKGIKPANLVIEQLTKKINWFKSSTDKEHIEWIKEAEIRMSEGFYHPTWELKIMKYEI